MVNLKFAWDTGKRIHKVAKDALGMCDSIPANVVCVPNPARPICFGIAIGFIIAAQVSMVAGEIGYKATKLAYDNLVILDGESKDVYLYTKHLYDRFKNFDEWSDKSLGIINKNMVDQHDQMRGELKNRHTLLEDNLGRLISEQHEALTTYIGEDVACWIVESLGASCTTTRRLEGELVADKVGEQEDDGTSKFVLPSVEWPEGHVFNSGGTLQGLKLEMNEMKAKHDELKTDMETKHDELKASIAETKASIAETNKMLAELLGQLA